MLVSFIIIASEPQAEVSKYTVANANYSTLFSSLNSFLSVNQSSSTENQRIEYTCAIYMDADVRMFTNALRDGQVALAE